MFVELLFTICEPPPSTKKLRQVCEMELLYAMEEADSIDVILSTTPKCKILKFDFVVDDMIRRLDYHVPRFNGMDVMEIPHKPESDSQEFSYYYRLNEFVNSETVKWHIVDILSVCGLEDKKRLRINLRMPEVLRTLLKFGAYGDTFEGFVSALFPSHHFPK